MVGFMAGCLKGYAAAMSSSNVDTLHAVCLGIGPCLQWSVEILQAALKLPENRFIQLAEELVSRSKWRAVTAAPDGTPWSTTQAVVAMHLEQSHWHFGASSNFAGWTGECPWDVFVMVWDKCIGQQSPFVSSDIHGEVLLALVVVLCTLRETDHKSLTVAASAVSALHQCGGVAVCVRECLQEDTCSSRCNLRKCLAHTFKESEHHSVNVAALRQAAQRFPCLLGNESRSPSGETWYAWVASHTSEWLHITGVGPVVLTKLLSLIWSDSDVSTDTQMAWDSRFVGVVLGLSPRTEAIVASQAYGFPAWVDYQHLRNAFQAAGLQSLSDTCKVLHESKHTALVQQLNSRRSALANWLQGKLTDVASSMCTHAGKQADMRTVRGLRESIRFLYDLYGV